MIKISVFHNNGIRDIDIKTVRYPDKTTSLVLDTADMPDEFLRDYVVNIYYFYESPSVNL